MNKPIAQAEIEKQARETAMQDFALAAHYAHMINDHLAVGDYAGAIWDMEQFKAAGRRAFAAFAPVRAGIMERGRAARQEAAE